MGKATLDDPALTAEAGPVCCAAAGDDGCDAERAQQPPVLVVVIAAVGEQPVGLLTWPPDLAGDGSPVKVFDQRDQLCDVVAVPAGESDRKRDAAGVDEQMVL